MLQPLSERRRREHDRGSDLRPGWDRSGTVTAVVIGDMDLVRPVRRAGADVVAVAGADDAVRFSRDVVAVLDPPEPYSDEALVALLEDAVGQSAMGVPLFYQGDRELLAISAHRDRLSTRYAFVLPPHELVVDLVDKARFQLLAERLGLPVPPARLLRCADVSDYPVDRPVLVKPLNRAAHWRQIGMDAKAVRVTTHDQLVAVASTVQDHLPELLVQELVEGDEDRIESYHVYVDEAGVIAAEFTGRKVRTHPRRFGFTTSLEITAAPDIAELGREVIRRVGLRGVAKVDIKRGPDGRLWVLEVNPRFNLWHFPGAVAGVNLPAMVLADLTGRPRPPSTTATPGIRWSAPLRDLRAAREEGTPLRSWLAWVLRCDTFQDLSWRDPSPFVRGVAGRAVRRRIPRRR